ncbi:MAG: helicase-related protein [Pseudomonadota bacterium]
MSGHADRTIAAVLGPTNTGKTHYALERMLARGSGVIGLPLRLLAREIYDRIVALRGPNAVALITGEEKIAPPTAKYHVCTVEAMPTDGMADFVAIDEIQLCADPDRGHVFTDRLLNARGRYETLLLGSDVARPRIANLVPEATFMTRERFSTLTWTGTRKISRLKPRTAVVAFSVDQVYAIAELIRRQRGGAAVVMGALSPRTRNAQVALYQEGEVDYMVATDAIGMGLNMDVDHVAFAGTSKFDGQRHRHLMANELAQIAGRAGRYTKDGTFSVTGEASPLDPEVVDAIENHRFKPLTKLMWRNTRLRYATVPALIASLEESPDQQDLVRAREAEDQVALKTLWSMPEIQDLATSGDRVRLLWDVCQVPDFRKVSPAEHASLLATIYRFLLGDSHCIPSDWFSGQIRRLDRVDGDIDALSKRLAFIRTWTYAANRPIWVEDAEHWRGETRAVEDRLSDALHARLTQRFVDRRTSILMRRLKQKEHLVAEVSNSGDVTAEGQYLGRLDGFRFSIDEKASGDELKTLRSASLAALQSEFARRADKFYLSPDTEIDATDQGGLMWGSDAVGKMVKGDDVLAPKVVAFVDDMAEPAVSEKIERRLGHWLTRKINALFEPLIAMRDDETITGLARGVAFQLIENFGIIARREIAQDIKALAQEERALLRKHGVRFGQHFIFMPALLKPAPTRMRLLLWSLAQDVDVVPDAPPPGHVTIPAVEGAPGWFYEKAGYRLAGQRAVRVDMLERLTDMLRPMDARAGFEATPDMLSITGCTPEQFADIMTGLGFAVETGAREKQIRAPAPKPGADADAGSAASSDTATASAVAEDAADATPAAAEVTEPVDAPPAAREAAPEEASVAEAPAAEPAPETASEAEPSEATAEATQSEAAPEETPPVTEQASDAAETEEAATDTKDDDAATEATPGEPEMETFYIFRQQPRRRPNRQGQETQGTPRGRERSGGGERQGGKGRQGQKDFGGKPGKKSRQGGKKGGRDGQGKPAQYQAGPKPKKDKPVDADSPFAILQQLKDR